MCRSTASSILSTRVTSSSVSGVALRMDQVVDAVGLLLDLVGEPALAPRIVPIDAAATLRDLVTEPGDDLALALFGELRVQEQQKFVVDQVFPFSFLRSESAPSAGAAGNGRRETEQEADEG